MASLSSAIRRVDDLARWLAVATVVVCALPVLVRMATDPEQATDPRRLAWLALMVAFLAAFWIHSGAPECAPRRRHLASYAVLTALALAMVWLVPYTLLGVLLVIVASGLGEMLRLPWAAAWIVGQSAVFTAAVVVDFQSLGDALTVGASFLAFQLFALYTSHTAHRERKGRAALARANAELVATRRLLEESSRSAERLRIARDLHDVVGHHLTALSLHLEAARHAAPAEARGEVETARGIAGDLLAEVRRVVGRLREEGPVDLAAALAELARGIQRPRVHLVLADGFRGVDDPQSALALLRCAQEMMTNAVRHAGAENLWLELSQGPDGIELSARDDGRGAPGGGRRGAGGATGDSVGQDGGIGGDRGDDGVGGEGAGRGSGEGGVGLAGMRERLERLGGRLVVDGRPGRGFRVTASLPAAAPASGEP